MQTSMEAPLRVSVWATLQVLVQTPQELRLALADRSLAPAAARQRLLAQLGRRPVPAFAAWGARKFVPTSRKYRWSSAPRPLWPQPQPGRCVPAPASRACDGRPPPLAADAPLPSPADVPHDAPACAPSCCPAGCDDPWPCPRTCALGWCLGGTLKPRAPPWTMTCAAPVEGTFDGLADPSLRA